MVVLLYKKKKKIDIGSAPRVEAAGCGLLHAGKTDFGLPSDKE